MPVLFRDFTRPDTEHPLHGVGGWLALFVGVVGVQVIVAIFRLPGIVSSTVAAASAARAFSLLAFMLAIEVLYPLAVAGFGTWGVVHTIRRDPRVPSFWGVFLAVSAGYALVEIVCGHVFLYQLSQHATGADLAGTKEQMWQAELQNFRLIIWAPIWCWYWRDSERVRVTFGGNAWRRSVGLGTPASPDV